MSAPGRVTGIILAGGRGRRVGNRDKGLIAWRGRPLIAHVSARLQPQVGSLLISCNRNAISYRSFCEHTVEDKRGDYQGPLAGLEAARELIDTPYTAICPCDTPRLPTDLVTRLLDGVNRADADIGFADDGERMHYLCALLRTECLGTLPGFLDGGRRAVKEWYADHTCTRVDFSDCAGSFANFNNLL